MSNTQLTDLGMKLAKKGNNILKEAIEKIDNKNDINKVQTLIEDKSGIFLNDKLTSDQIIELEKIILENEKTILELATNTYEKEIDDIQKTREIAKNNLDKLEKDLENNDKISIWLVIPAYMPYALAALLLVGIFSFYGFVTTSASEMTEPALRIVDRVLTSADMALGAVLSWLFGHAFMKADKNKQK